MGRREGRGQGRQGACVSQARAMVLAGCALLAGSGACLAQYPDRPVRVIVPFAPGGGTDITTRLMAAKLGESMGQTFIIDNRPGAGSMLGTEIAARATPDGYTLLGISPEFTVNPSLQPKVPYDALRDFTPIVRMTFGQYILAVRLNVPATSVKALIAYAKANPKLLSYGSSGNGSANHLAGELFKSMAGIDMVHIPYKGSGPSNAAFLSGDVQVLFSSITAIVPHVNAGRVRALAVTGPKRLPVSPNTPTVSEAGLPGYEVTGWYGLIAPAKTPATAIERLNAEANRALPSLKDRYAEFGSEIVGGSAREFGDFLAQDIAKWAKVVKISGARPD